MKAPSSLRHLPATSPFGTGDVFVLFGELFGRGYANGLVQQAREAGMTIIGMTVGRREADGRLRPLLPEELQQAEQQLGGRIINVPLMAGFDMDAPEGMPTPTDMLSRMTLKSWLTDRLDWTQVEACREVGRARFQDAVAQAMSQLDEYVPDGARVLFGHTMAGGLVRAKVFLAIANRVYKGRGDRFMSSRTLLDSDLGKLNLMNFDEVTANTFGYLIQGSAALRQRLQQQGGEAYYTAYGYHGTEVLIQGEYQWQTYTNYTQGYAKMRLEGIARDARSQGVRATVFNCPEIRTNSSDIFVGVELSLFPLLEAMRREGCGAWGDAQWAACEALLSDGGTVADVLQQIDHYNAQDTSAHFRQLDPWPMDNSPELAELMIGTSERITGLHRDRNALITDLLSAQVIEATGPLMFHGIASTDEAVLWLNHDIIARQLAARHGDAN